MDKFSTIVSSILATLTVLGLSWAFADSFIDEKYVSHPELQTIQRSILNDIRSIQRDSIQEKIHEIDDKEIDGAITSTDLKKRIRLQSKLKSFEQL